MRGWKPSIGVLCRCIILPARLQAVAMWASNEISKRQVDAIACTGTGSVVAGAVSLLTLLPVVYVRKPRDSPMGSSYVLPVVAQEKPQAWVWLDDCIAMGTTLRNAVKQIGSAPSLIVLYADGGNVLREPKSWHAIAKRLPCVGWQDLDEDTQIYWQNAKVAQSASSADSHADAAASSVCGWLPRK